MTKGKALEKIWEALPEERRIAIEVRAQQKIDALYSLQELRKLAGLTQASLSDNLGLPQSNISRLEKNSDMLLSTLNNYIEAMGGTLRLTVELPHQPPIELKGISDLLGGEPSLCENDFPCRE